MKEKSTLDDLIIDWHIYEFGRDPKVPEFYAGRATAPLFFVKHCILFLTPQLDTRINKLLHQLEEQQTAHYQLSNLETLLLLSE